eukprot:CAMPEP_0119104486 /NCGR_PEP_ID=MMETSP1180-20130426/2674_1 /TAXON_ID=3052 ORGANISM="Chlamydomonas cf sp, Strain CCMP681" /NCGR_SAMPLE_ID=MMETSP1180 /ASSEMBLY_ACC=CAM_ASM_000741 /LENGTH=490 /DNA_ID=CAMNT_0007089259 /DNA_START=49 /DNA_END=1521 /DNA_ORIENTATION=-
MATLLQQRIAAMAPDISNHSLTPQPEKGLEGKLGGMKSQDSMSVDMEPELPAYDAITENRAGTTTSVMFHNVTAMVGAGILGLPSTMGYLGWAPGVIILILSLIVSWYTFYVLVILHEEVPEVGSEKEGMPIKRYNHYQELACRAFGPKRGIWVLMPFQIILLYGIAITYTVAGGSNLLSTYKLLGGSVVGIGPWVLIWSAVQIGLSQIPNFSALGWVSGVGAIMSVTYSVIAIVLAATFPTDRAVVRYTTPEGSEVSKLFGVFNALTTIAFAYGGHNIALEIQGTLPAGPYESTIPRMMLGMNVTFVATAIMYFGVAFTGFAAYGNSVGGNILDSIGQPVWVICMAHLAVVLHVFASYQVYSFTLFDMIERGVAKVVKIETAFKRTAVRVAIRTLYVFSTAFIACLIPFFGDLMSLFGAIGVTPTTFVLPPIMWLILRKPSWKTPAFWGNWIIAIVMTVVGFFGAIAAIRTIVLNASKYKVFSGFDGHV